MMLRELADASGSRSTMQLVEHPTLLTDDFEEPKVSRVLYELEALGLARETPPGWRLTDDGITESSRRSG